ncbi:MAG: aminotransferase class III-fold pyridoxal phosphate-dependent enzyme, partial [Candidatus Bathyarchaeia archaeon]
CDETGVLLIIDEVQTGMGRTGKMFACEHWGIAPDILCIAKSIAGGLPLGATLTTEEIASKLEVGEHTSTFGGNPVACAAAAATIDVLLRENLLEHVAKVGKYFLEKLKELQVKHRIVRDARGLGLMLGLELRIEVLNVILGAIQRGVLLLDAGRTVVRFLPPFIITEKEVNEAITVLDEILNGEAGRIRCSVFSETS